MAANPYAGVAEPVDSYAGIAEPVAQTAPSAEAPASPYAGVAEPENTPAQSPQASQTPTAAQEDAQYGTITAYHPSVSDSVKKVYDALFNAIPTQPRHEPGVLPQWSDVPDALIGGPIRTMVQPGGIAAIATGLAGPAVAAKALGVAFGAQGAYQTIKNAPTTWGTLTDPNATGPEQALAVGNEAINAAMGAAGFASGVSMVRGFRGTPEVAEPIQSTTTEPPILPTTVKPAEEPTPSPYAGIAEPVAQPAAAMTPPAAPENAYAGVAEPVTPPTEGAGDTHGIAQRVNEARAEAGQIEPIAPGQGISTVVGLDRGRELLSGGADPYEALRQFGETGRMSVDDMALMRAQGEALSKAASDAADEHGPASPEYEAARQADSNWAQAIKPLSTAWQGMGMLQQGEVDLDTGDFHSLNKAYQDATGRPFTPEQAVEAQKVADTVTKAQDDATDAQQQVFDFFNSTPRSFDDPGVKQVWNLMKEYLDSGQTDFDAIRQKIAADTGLTIQDVTEKLTQHKGSGPLTDDMYAKMSIRRQAILDAKNWLRAQQMAPLAKLATNVPNAAFMTKTLGHGTVGMVTHAALNAFDPMAWEDYAQSFKEQYPLLGWHDGGAFHEMRMQDLTHDPNFITARRAGLANDPSRLIDDYQSTWAGNFLRKIGISGNKGFDALKLFRQDSFNRFWDGLPKSSQTPEMAKMIANRVNHSTGVIKTSLPVWANKVLFAPKLEASRWAWLIGDPAKATAIVSKGLRNGWDTLRPDEKAMVNQEFSQKARIAGTYYGLLAFNQAMLKLGGSSQQINFTNPSRNDFMAFKAMGYKVQPMAPMLGLVRLLANEIHAATSNSRGESRYDTMGKTAIDYGRGKLSPIGGLVADQATQADYMGRPLPFSDQKLPPRLAHQGIGKYTVGQYAAQNLTPIPVGEVAQQLQGMGMSKNQASRYIGAIVSGLVMGATGIRVSRDTSPQAASSH